MKKINKGLLYEQYHSLKLIVVLFSILTIIYSYLMGYDNIRYSIHIENASHVNFFNRINNLDILTLSMVVCILIIFSYGISKRKSMLFLGAAPMSRKEIIYGRAFSVLMAIGIILFIDLYINLFLSLKHWHYLSFFNVNYNFLLDSFMRTFILGSVSIFMVSLFTFCQIVMNNGILSALLGYYIMAYPFILFSGTYLILFESFYEILTCWGDKLVEIFGKENFIMFLGDPMYLLDNIFNNTMMVNVLIACILGVLGVMLFLLVDVKLFKQLDVECNTKIFTNKHVEKFVLWATAIIGAIGVSIGIYVILQNILINTSVVFLVKVCKFFVVITLISIYPLYLLLKKIISVIEKIGMAK